MNKQDAFNTLFEKGSDYEVYTNRSEQHVDTMQKSFDATAQYLQQLNQGQLDQANHPLKVVVIAENWCGDCAKGVPVITKLAQTMDTWELRIAQRDDFDEIVEQYYTTAGRKKIPVVIFADKDGDEINRWVERPTRSYQILAELQAKQLPKEDYIKEYKSNPELRPPEVTQNIVDELLQLATKAATLIKILPTKRS